MTRNFALAAVIAAVSRSAFAADPHEGAVQEARDALEAFTIADADVQQHLDDAAGYVVFPSVGKAGVVLGGGGGEGVLFEKGVPVGKARVTFVNVGAQVGGQRFRELIILQSKAALKDFKRGRAAFQAGASAVAAGTGAAAQLQYQNGVAVMTKALGGLMAEATIGGQKFEFLPYSKPVPRT